MAVSKLDYPQVIKSVYNSDNSSLNVTSLGGALITVPYDYLAMTYSGSNLTIVQYYSGGAGGTLVGTLTLAYSGSNITSITKS